MQEEEITCPHCTKKFKINSGQMLAKLSILKRKPTSEDMRNLVNKRWSTRKSKIVDNITTN